MKSSLLTFRTGLLVILASFCVIYVIDFSFLYHKIRGQSVVKLYVIFNVFDVAEKLCSSFGSDIISYCCFFSTTSSVSFGKELIFYSLACFYVMLHCIVLVHQWLALHVAVNSFNNGLLTLLISTQFIEVKSSVFKRWDSNTKHHEQLIWSDSVERVHLSIFLLLIYIKNWIEEAGCIDNSLQIPGFSILKSVLFVFGSEILVDWIKHSFIVKLNNIEPSIIAGYSKRISFWEQDEKLFEGCFKHVGFSIIPMICLILSSIYCFVGISGLIVLWMNCGCLYFIFGLLKKLQ